MIVLWLIGTVALRVTDKTEMGSSGCWITAVKKCFNLEHIAGDTSTSHFDFSLRGPIRRRHRRRVELPSRDPNYAATPLVLTIVGNTVCPDNVRIRR